MSRAERVQREKEFHDQRFESGEERRSARFYALNKRSIEAHQLAIDAISPDASVLEIGCGDNSQVWHLTNRRRRCVAIDISPVAVDRARQRCQDSGIHDIEFLVMDAESLEFEDASFDVVIGLGVLHHLDLAKAMPGIARVLRPDGVGLFVEPMGHNPAVNLYRRLTPSERTEDEHPFKRRDLNSLREWFATVDLQFFHALSLGAIPFIGSRAFDRVLEILDIADQRLLTASATAQNLAWIVTMELRNPKIVKR